MKKVVLLNMCRIRNAKTGEVVVLDKIKKEGWEGYTFPGGHVEPGEGMVTAIRREILEETGLRLGKVEFSGFFQWIDEKAQLVAMLFDSMDYTGTLLESTREGKNFWMDYEEFKKLSKKSDSMDDILKIYDGESLECLSYFERETLSRVEFF